MKSIILILIAFSLFQFCSGQKVSNLPVDATVDATDLIITVDKGTTTKKMTMSTLMGAVSISSDSVRNEMIDSLQDVRAAIGGGTALSKSGHNVYVTDAADTITVGSTTKGSHKFNIIGNTRIYGDLYEAGILRLTGPYNTGTGTIYSNGNDLYFDDATNTPKTLTQLITGNTIFTTYSTTYYPSLTTYNWNFGGSTSTSYKVNVEGNLNTTGEAHFGATNYDTYINGTLRIPNSGWISFANSGGKVINSYSTGMYFAD